MSSGGYDMRRCHTRQFARLPRSIDSNLAAALQTGKAAIATFVEPTYWGMLDKQASDRESVEYVKSTGNVTFRPTGHVHRYRFERF